MREFGKLPKGFFEGERSPKNVFGTLLHSPRVLGGYIPYWVDFKNICSLSVREQELVILRMAVNNECDYVFSVHRDVALQNEVTIEEIHWITVSNLDSFSDREALLLKLTDQISNGCNVSDDLWDQANRVMITAQNIVDLIHLISQYVLYCSVNNVFQVDLEEGLTGIPA